MQENEIHQSESDPRLHVYINVLIQKCSSKKNYLLNLNLNNKNCKRSKTFGTGRPAFEKFFQRTRQSYYWRYRLNFSFYISNTNLTKSSSTDNLSSCCSFNSGLLYKVSSLCKHTSHTYTHTTSSNRPFAHKRINKYTFLNAHENTPYTKTILERHRMNQKKRQ